MVTEVAPRFSSAKRTMTASQLACEVGNEVVGHVTVLDEVQVPPPGEGDSLGDGVGAPVVAFEVEEVDPRVNLDARQDSQEVTLKITKLGQGPGCQREAERRPGRPKGSEVKGRPAGVGGKLVRKRTSRRD